MSGSQAINPRKEKDRLLMKELGIRTRKSFVKRMKLIKRIERAGKLGTREL